MTLCVTGFSVPGKAALAGFRSVPISGFFFFSVSSGGGGVDVTPALHVAPAEGPSYSLLLGKRLQYDLTHMLRNQMICDSDGSVAQKRLSGFSIATVDETLCPIAFSGNSSQAVVPSQP